MEISCIRPCSFIVRMQESKKILESIKTGSNPFIEDKISLMELTAFYLEETRIDEASGPYILKACEEYFDKILIKDQLASFKEFFKLASLFQRDKNSINRFFDSILGLYSSASEAKLLQIALEKKGLTETHSMRVRGSFEYSHTQTHYSILMDLFNYLAPIKGERFTDIGSGFGRVGMFIGLCFPELRYTGFELVEDRVTCSIKAQMRNQFNNLDFQTKDLLKDDFKLPPSDYYFFYDPFDIENLSKFYQSHLDKPNLKIIAFEGYDDSILNFFDSCKRLSKVKVFQDDYFSIGGALYESN